MSVEQVPAPEWENWIALNQGVLIDIREPREWEQGTLEGARLISVGDLLESMESMDRSTPILLVCRSGSRSHQAAAFMEMSGFKAVANLAGGMHALGLQA